MTIDENKGQNKKKILHIVEAMGGGVFTYMVELTNRLVEKYDVYVAYATRQETPEDYKDYFDERIHLIKVENFGREINYKRDFQAMKEVKDIVKKVEPSIVHLHSSKAGAIGRVVINGRKVPLFYTPHGYSFLINNHGGMHRLFYWILEASLGLTRCTTISCSRGEHIDAAKITRRSIFIENGVDMRKLNELIPIPYEERGTRSFTVYTMGRICGQKNPVLFNEIAKQLPHVQFVWIGDGYKRELITSENIRVTGWLDREEAIHEAMNGDVFLLNSYWEGLPISLLESMYMYKPCVVSDVSGNHDVVNDGVNGFICRTAEEYVAVLKRLEHIYGDEVCPESEKEYLRILLLSARNDIETTYNVTSMTEKYSAVYEQAMRE